MNDSFRVCAACWLAFAATVAARAAESRPPAVQADARQVKRLGRIEFTIQPGAGPRNPYDPRDLDLWVELTGPAGKKLACPAFYYQPCERQQRRRGGRPAEWIYPAGKGLWKARFTPTEAGQWSCVALRKGPGEPARSAAVTFACTPADGRGFVRVSRDDSHYLQFDSGAGFFPVGQNVAFVTDSYKSIDMLDKLAANGANFVRIWACCEDWAMAVEARKSGWGRSWGWNPPIVHVPGREGFHSDDRCVGLRGEAGARLSFSPTRPLAPCAKTKYRLSGLARTDTGAGFAVELGGGREDEVLKCAKGKWTPFRLDFTAGENQWWLERLSFRSLAKCTMYLKDLSLREAAGGPELLAEARAGLPLIGHYNQVDCFMLDRLVDAAEKRGLYLQLVMFTRDHYMGLLKRPHSREYDRAIDFGRRLVRYFVARWGFSTNVAVWEYFNEIDPGLPAERFYRELGEYFERIDVNRHLRGTSGWASPSKSYRHAKLDTADAHWYMRPVNAEHWKDAAACLLHRTALCRKEAPGKPLLFAEFGMTDNKWRRPKEVDQDKEFVHIHNALWASAVSGLAGSACPWFWDDIHKKDMYHHYRPISAFVADVPYAKARLRPAAAACDKPVRVVALAGREAAYLWIANPQATWWQLGIAKTKPAEVRGASVTVKGLADGNYRVQWWDTWQGKPTSDAKARSSKGALRVEVPPFTRDVACKIVR